MISKKIVSQLQKICGKDGVSLHPRDQISYSRDCSTASLIQARERHFPYLPDAIVWPRNIEEVSKVLKIANQNRIPIIPYGAGSGVCGGAIPLKAGIILDLKKMDQILSIDSDTLTVTAQSGILGEILEQKLQRQGFTLGHFPSSIYTATLGGYLACRSAGQLSTKYGKIEDMILSFTVCLADGRIVRLNKGEKTDLTELFLGSEGTLGVILEATLKIHPSPEAQKYFGITFPSVAQGLTAIRRFIQRGYKPAVVRLYNPLDSFFFSLHGSSDAQSSSSLLTQKVPSSLRSLLQLFHTQSFRLLLSQSRWINRLIDLSLSKSLMILGFEGAAWKLDVEFKEVIKICQSENGKNLGESTGLQWLKNRYAAGYKMSPIIDQGCFADTMEVASSWSKIEDLYDAVRKAIGRYALVMAHFSHVYEEGASIYFTFGAYASGEKKSLELHRKIWDEALEACMKAGGTISHHHGIGFLKQKAFIQESGLWIDWFQKVKNYFDPHQILNPGKMGLKS